MPGFDLITFTFCENSNYWRESLLEVIRQNIAGRCQQTFGNKHPKQTFPPTEVEGDWIESRLPFKIFLTLRKKKKIVSLQGNAI